MKYKLKNKEIELTQEEVNEIIKQNATLQKEKTLGLQIKNRFTGEVIFQSTKTTWKKAAEEAKLSEADLRLANLCGANLHKADLSETDLSEADLYRANLSEADLRGADLSGAELRGANLYGANLSGANLRNARFNGKGCPRKLKQTQVKDFLLALGFIIEE